MSAPVESSLRDVYNAVDKARYRVLTTEPDPMFRVTEEDLESYSGYANEVGSLEAHVRFMSKLLDAARDPFEPGAAEVLEAAIEEIEGFQYDGATGSVLSEAGRCIRIDRELRRGRDPRVVVARAATRLRRPRSPSGGQATPTRAAKRKAVRR